MKNYTINKYLDDDDIKSLLEYYHKQEIHYAHQDYNLFNLEKRRAIFEDKWPDPIEKLNGIIGLKPLAHYFLKYVEGSFTRMHTDDNNRVGKTVVTVLEKENLEGGYAIINDIYPLTPRPKHKYAKRAKGSYYYNKPIVPVALNPNVGESLTYSYDVQHAVSKVMKGHRIVLISWYEND